MRYLLHILLLFSLIMSFSKDYVAPENSYDNVDYGNNDIAQYSLILMGLT